MNLESRESFIQRFLSSPAGPIKRSKKKKYLHFLFSTTTRGDFPMKISDLHVIFLEDRKYSPLQLLRSKIVSIEMRVSMQFVVKRSESNCEKITYSLRSIKCPSLELSDVRSGSSGRLRHISPVAVLRA